MSKLLDPVSWNVDAKCYRPRRTRRLDTAPGLRILVLQVGLYP